MRIQDVGGVMPDETATLHPSIQAQIDRDMLAGLRQRSKRFDDLIAALLERADDWERAGAALRDTGEQAGMKESLRRCATELRGAIETARPGRVAEYKTRAEQAEAKLANVERPAKLAAAAALNACYEAGRLERALKLIGARGPVDLTNAIDRTAWLLHEIGGYGCDEISAVFRGELNRHD